MGSSIDRRFSRSSAWTGLLEGIRTSFWFTPGLMLVGASLLAAAATWLDQHRMTPWAEKLYRVSPDAARTIVSSVASAMITVATVTYSIMIVALSFASGQLGPRLLRNFIRDRTNQVVLGGFLSIFLYCLLVIGFMQPIAGSGTGTLHVLIALGLAVVGVFLLIYFIHHVAISLQADSVVAGVHQNLVRAVNRLLPDANEDELPDEEPAAELREGDGGKHAAAVHGDRSGYVQSIDYEHLVDVAERLDIRLVCPVLAGDFVSERTILAWSETETDAEELTDEVVDAFLIGSSRTDAQDLAYSIRQMVEVALRALSPGVNDPYTAMICLDHLGDAVSILSRRRLIDQRVSDGNEERLVRAVVGYRDFVSAAFDEIRSAALGDVRVTCTLLTVLGRVHRATTLAARRQEVERLGSCVIEQAEGLGLHSRDRTVVARSAEWLTHRGTSLAVESDR